MSNGEWQPAVFKSYEDNYAHALGQTAKTHQDLKDRLRRAAGKTILVRPCLDPEFACGCGAPTVEVERKSAATVLPGWGGLARPTMCSEMLYLD